MSRCASAWASASRRMLAAALLLAALLPSAHAQLERRFPPDALRGDMTFGQPPAAALNGTSVQLAPGVRIRDEANRLVLTGEAQGVSRMVHYTVDLYGQPLLIWWLTDAERALLWPRTREQAQAWLFDEATQRWTRP